MSAAHDPECEKAEPGSLCDCDCAGARHAVRRTAGNIAAAGAVSRRARKIAEKDGRAPVVNRLVPPEDAPDAGRHRRAGRHREDVLPPPAQRRPRTPAVLSRETKAKIAKVRKSLPKDDAGWKAAAREPVSEDRMIGFRQQLDRLRATAEHTQAQREALVTRVATEHVIPKELLADKRLGYTKDTPGLMDMAIGLAHHRIYDVPAYDAERQQLDQDAYNAKAAFETGERALAELAKGAYPFTVVDDGNGGREKLRMPTRKLSRHLKAVRDAGRAVLDEARAKWQADQPPAVAAAQQVIKDRADTDAAVRMLKSGMRADLRRGGFNAYGLPDEGDEMNIQDAGRIKQLLDKYQARLEALDAQVPDAQHTIAAHQYQVLREMLTEHRNFGGRGHDQVTAERDALDDLIVDPDKKRGAAQPRSDWKERLAVAEQHFPTDWLAASGARPLKVGASHRAYYGGSLTANLLSMPSHDHDGKRVGGALDYVDEVNVHELGHRMEIMVPGLTHLEFAYVRERGVDAKGKPVLPRSIVGYADKDEISQEDHWQDPYTGKTYEKSGAGLSVAPGELAWEVFQVGLQETWGRGERAFGPRDDPDGLQAFTIGALLTLG